MGLLYDKQHYEQLCYVTVSELLGCFNSSCSVFFVCVSYVVARLVQVTLE